MQDCWVIMQGPMQAIVENEDQHERSRWPALQRTQLSPPLSEMKINAATGLVLQHDRARTGNE